MVNENVKYHFSASAQYESEFTVYDDNTPVEVHPVSGTIVLDRNFDFVFDEKGDILLEPYKTLLRKESFNKAEQKKTENSNERSDNKILSQNEVDDLLSGIDS